MPSSDLEGKHYLTCLAGSNIILFDTYVKLVDTKLDILRFVSSLVNV